MFMTKTIDVFKIPLVYSEYVLRNQIPKCINTESSVNISIKQGQSASFKTN